jgi:hypothetical protein
MSDHDELFDLDDPDHLQGTIVPNRLLRHIGSIAVYYSNLDHALSAAIWKLLGLKERRGQIVTQASASFASRVEMFKVLANQKYKSQKMRARISDLATHLRLAGDDRNRLMHDVIFYSEGANDSATAAIKTMRSHPLTNSANEYFFDRATMRDLRDRLSELWFLLYCFCCDQRDWRDDELPSLDKSPTQLQRKKNEDFQKQAQQQRRPISSRRKSRSKRKTREA